MRRYITLLGFHFTASLTYAQLPMDTVKQNTNAHFQMTIISQGHLSFRSAYEGMNSLGSKSDWGATSLSATLFLEKKIWKGATFYFNPEVSGGQGLSGSLGVAGALNGEIYRVGSPAPSVYIARAYWQQQIPLTKKNYEWLNDDENQISEKVATERITISAGKFSMADFFDDNNYSHDPRTQFFNWALMANGAWDYPANTRGYTSGVMVEYYRPKWQVRATSVMVPVIANGSKMEYVVGKAHAEAIEICRSILINKKPGMIRLVVAQNYNRAPSYRVGIHAIQINDTALLNVFAGNAEGTKYGGKKFTLGISADQQINNSLGVFLRAGWNDGKYATWAFTEIDQTMSGGLILKGDYWKRPSDNFGIACAINGISKYHRDFLANGGNGFIIGDGKLNYGHEVILETFYAFPITHFFTITADYQFVNHPAYNKDRGPVNVFSLRGHVSL